MGNITRQTVSEAGLAPSYAAVAASDQIIGNDGSTFLHVKNGGGSSDTVTIVAQVTAAVVPGLGPVTRGNIVVSVPATTGDRMIGPIPRVGFEDGNGNIQVTHSFQTSVTCAAISVPKAA